MSAGYKGIGFRSPSSLVAPLGNAPFDFNPNLIAFTPSMAKRATSVFAASPIIQGARDGTGTPDVLSAPRGSLLLGSYFYANFDWQQGSIVFRITPEWNGNDNLEHHICNIATFVLHKHSNNRLYISVGGQAFSVDVSTWVAGTVYNICFRWDTKNTLDGSNYICTSINDTHTFGATIPLVLGALGSTIYIGSNGGTATPANAIIEGFTIYRRVLYDGTYGVNVGNGDEVALIAAGIDPCTVTGSWDVVFCLPTNSTPGELTTGTGNAWSHPHASNLLTRGFLNDRYYGGGEWGVKFNGTSTMIDCGSGATLDDVPSGATVQIEAWVLCTGASNHFIFSKGVYATSGIHFYVGSNELRLNVYLATTGAVAGSANATLGDGKWHHVLAHYNDTTKVGRVAIDGVWSAAGAAGVGAYVSDAANNLMFGRRSDSGLYWFVGSMGWIRYHNHEHYTSGTNFVPPRAYPGDDAGTVEHWSLNEGTGATAAATVTSPANDGTISNGTWEPQWHDVGSPIIDYSVIGSTTYRTDVGSDASIDDLADNAFTVEGWFRIPKTGALQVLMYKGTYGSTGWRLFVSASGILQGNVECATTDPLATGSMVADNLWHLIKMTFDDAGDRCVRLYVDNVLVNTSVAGVGAIVSDAAQNGAISYNNFGVSGAHGWIRWSNVVRGAGMISRSNPPAVDANTMAQWNCTEGAGAALADATGVNNGTMAGTYSWGITPAMETDSPGARAFAWGYVFGSDAANEGVEQTWTGLTAGSNYVVRALAYSEDGVGQPEIEIYDETNAAVIADLLGTVASTERSPDMLNLSFELPTVARGAAADCTSVTIRLLNNAATGVVGWHQVEWLANLIDNPGLETGAGDPWIPDGWTNDSLDLGDTEQEAVGGTTHSGNAVEWNTGASNEGIYRQLTVAANQFIDAGLWSYGDGSAGFVFHPASGASRLQYSSTLYAFATPHTAAWAFSKALWRISVANPNFYILADAGAVGDRFTDDVYAILCDDVSLTCTPASAANSVESGGVRVDGLDRAPQPIPAGRMFPVFGWLRFRWIPRHSIADMDNFGYANPIIGYLLGDAANFLSIDLSAPNTIRIGYISGGGPFTSGTWAAAGALVAGASYLFEVLWTPSETRLIVDGITRITFASGPMFPVVPTSFYPGSTGGTLNQVDAVFLAP